jgi:hypothetical protein
MSSEKLQKAITLIKSGDKKGGQNLLVDIVNLDPKNEVAWLWLASVVSQDKRIFCLEKVLGINPNNVQAKQYLEKIKNNGQTQSNTAIQPSVASKENTPRVIEQSTPSNSPQYWVIPFKLSKSQFSRVIILENTRLVVLEVVPIKVPAIFEQSSRGSLTKEWVDKNIISQLKYVSIPFNQILQVRFLFRIKVDYRDETGKESLVDIDCEKDETSKEFIEALQKRLGNSFTLMSKPNSRWEVAGRSLIMLIVTFGITGFCYWGTIDLGTEELHGRYSGIGTLLQLIGPNGILCISGGIFILLLIFIVSQLVKPPMETLLVRKGSSKS